MTTKTLADKEALLERMQRATADARVNGQESSKYFLDKCDAEAGFINECNSSELASPQRNCSPWDILFGKT